MRCCGEPPSGPRLMVVPRNTCIIAGSRPRASKRSHVRARHPLPVPLQGLRPQPGGSSYRQRGRGGALQPRARGRDYRGRQRRPRRKPRRAPDRDGLVRVGQVDSRPLSLAAHRAFVRFGGDRGHGPAHDERQGAHRSATQQDGHGVSELCPSAPPHRTREHRLPAADAGHEASRLRGSGAQDDWSRRS